MNLTLNFNLPGNFNGVAPMHQFGGLQQLMGLQMAGMGMGCGMPAMMASPESMIFQLLSRMMGAPMSPGIPNHGSCPCNCYQNGLPSPGWSFPRSQGPVFRPNMPNFPQFDVPRYQGGCFQGPGGPQQMEGPTFRPRRPLRLGAEQIAEQLKGGEYGEVYSKLSPEQQKQALNVFGSSQRGGRLSPDMMKLFGSDRFLSQDAQGKSVLDHLDRLSSAPLQDGVHRGEALNDMARTLNDYKTWNQDGQGTCTVTAIGREHIRTNPADFARVNTELLTEGKAKTLKGDEIQLASGDLGRPDKSGRTQLERAYQDAMMEFGNGDATYDAANDQNSHTKKSGLSTENANRVARSVLGNETEVLGKSTRWAFGRDLDSLTEQGKTMQATMRWSEQGEKHAYHMVSVEKMKDGYVYLDNPWGEAGQGQLPKGVERSGEGGKVRLKEDEFFNRLEEYQANEVGAVEKVVRKSVSGWSKVADVVVGAFT